MSQKTKRNKGIKLIKKSNDLIEARYRFDIWETRVFTTVLGEIDQADEDFRVYRIYMRDIIRDFDLNNGDAYEQLRQATRNLMGKKFYVNYEHDGAIREQIFHIIRKADVMKTMLDETRRKANEYVDISIEPEMKPLLLELKSRFTTYDMQNVAKFKSSYTLRIYEHLKQYERIGKRTMDIEYMKRIFELSSEYPLFANFYQKIIQPAFRDINQYTDLTITNIEKIKDGKKVESLLFVFKPKTKEEIKALKNNPAPPQTWLELPAAKPKTQEKTIKKKSKTTDKPAAPNSEKDRLFLQFQDIVVGELGVSPTVFLQELGQDGTDETAIQQAVRVTRRAMQDGKVKNPSGFFIEALRKKFTDAQEQNAQKKKKATEKIAERERQIAAVQDAHAVAVNDKIRELTSHDPTLTEKTMEILRGRSFAKKHIENKESELQRPLTIEDFRQDKLLRDWVKLTIIEERKTEFADIISDYEREMKAFKK